MNRIAVFDFRIARAKFDIVPGHVRHVVGHLRRDQIHAGRADEITDESVLRPLEQLGRRGDLQDAAVLHHHDFVGEGQRFNLIVGHVDHQQVERAVHRLQLRAQLPFQRRIDHRQRLVEQHRRHIGAHQPSPERNFLLGFSRQARARRDADRRSDRAGRRSRRPAR